MGKKWQEQQRKYERDSYESEQREQMKKIFEVTISFLKTKDMKEVRFSPVLSVVPNNLLFEVVMVHPLEC